MRRKNSQTYTFSGEIHLLTLQFGKDFQKLLQKPNKLRSQIFLVLNVRRSFRETGPDGLFDIQDTGQVCPTVFVHRGLVLAITPRKRLSKKGRNIQSEYESSSQVKNEISYPVLLKQSLKGRAPWTSIHPDRQRIVPPHRAGREEPKEQLRSCLSGHKEQAERVPTSRVSFVLPLMGNNPAQLGPTSQSTSGIVFPST